MKKLLLGLLISLPFLGCAHGPSQDSRQPRIARIGPITSDDPLVRGRRDIALFYSHDPAAFYAQISAEAQRKQSLEDLKQIQDRELSRLGQIKKVVNEAVVSAEGVTAYLQQATFTKAEGVFDFVVAFDDAGKITAYMIQRHINR